MTYSLEILILDDEREAADLLAALLALHLPTAKFHVVYTGEDAVAVGTERRPHAAILDLEMSGLGGEGAANALRRALQDSQALFIALSGNVLRLAELRKKGPFDYLLSKPVDAAVLVQLLKSKVRAVP